MLGLETVEEEEFVSGEAKLTPGCRSIIHSVRVSMISGLGLRLREGEGCWGV